MDLFGRGVKNHDVPPAANPRRAEACEAVWHGAGLRARDELATALCLRAQRARERRDHIPEGSERGAVSSSLPRSDGFMPGSLPAFQYSPAILRGRNQEV